MFKVVALLAVFMADSNTPSVKANVLLCSREYGQLVYHFLEEHGLLESAWKPLPVGKMLALPFNSSRSEKYVRESVTSNFDFDIKIDCIQLERAEDSINPHARFLRAVEAWMPLGQESETEPLVSSLPKKWELLGDLVILPETAFEPDTWSVFFDNLSSDELTAFWQDIAQALGGSRLARQHSIAKDTHRTSQTELLFGENGWVEFLDHGVHFGFDATKVMFSSGNVTERRRIGMIDMQGEVVVDAYGGVGYYTLHMAMRSKAKHIHACEINPDSIAGLTWAREANGVGDKITIHQGNNQQTLPLLYSQADRCHLGLLPSSEAVWGHALRCLKPSGGWLHIHMNVHKDNLEKWQDSTLQNLTQQALEIGRNWNITVGHLERVKWFSPHVWHVVLDVECREISKLLDA